MPEMAQRLEALRTYIRKEASLPQRLQKMVMPTVAREMNCGFIWYAHAVAARQAGVRGEIVDCIREAATADRSRAGGADRREFRARTLAEAQSEQGQFRCRDGAIW